MTDLPASPVLLCVGDIDMDIIIRVPRPPGRDQKVDGERMAQTAGGMAANVAVGASRLGTATRLLGAVGDDAMGREALEALGREALDVDHVVTRHGAATFFCVIMLIDPLILETKFKRVPDARRPRQELSKARQA